MNESQEISLTEESLDDFVHCWNSAIQNKGNITVKIKGKKSRLNEHVRCEPHLNEWRIAERPVEEVKIRVSEYERSHFIKRWLMRIVTDRSKEKKALTYFNHLQLFSEIIKQYNLSQKLFDDPARQENLDNKKLKKKYKKKYEKIYKDLLDQLNKEYPSFPDATPKSQKKFEKEFLRLVKWLWIKFGVDKKRVIKSFSSQKYNIDLREQDVHRVTFYKQFRDRCVCRISEANHEIFKKLSSSLYYQFDRVFQKYIQDYLLKLLPPPDKRDWIDRFVKLNNAIQKTAEHKKSPNSYTNTQIVLIQSHSTLPSDSPVKSSNAQSSSNGSQKKADSNNSEPNLEMFSQETLDLISSIKDLKNSIKGNLETLVGDGLSLIKESANQVDNLDNPNIVKKFSELKNQLERECRQIAKKCHPDAFNHYPEQVKPVLFAIAKKTFSKLQKFKQQQMDILNEYIENPKYIFLNINIITSIDQIFECHINKIQEQIDEFDSSLKELNIKIKTTNTNINTLKNDVEKYKDKLDDIDAEIKKAKDQGREIKEEIERLKNEIAESDESDDDSDDHEPNWGPGLFSQS